MFEIRDVKYRYETETVYRFYQRNGMNYRNFIQVVLYQKKNHNKDLTTIIENTIQMHLRKKEFRRIEQIFMNLYDHPTTNISYIARELNLNYRSIFKIRNHHFSIIESIIILWYLSDRKDSKGRLRISQRQIMKTMNILNHETQNIDEIYLICFIKMGKSEYYNKFLNERQKYFTKLIYTYLNIYHVNQDYFSDIYQEISLLQVTILNKCCSRNIKEIMKYSNVSLRGKLIHLLIKIKKDTNHIYLDENINNHQTYFDIIPNTYS